MIAWRTGGRPTFQRAVWGATFTELGASVALDDSELLLGIWRHLSAYSVSPTTAALGDLEFAGKVYEMAWRLRGSPVSSAARVRAIGVEAKITPRELDKNVLPTLQVLGWASINRTADGQLDSLEAVIPPPSELIAAADQVLRVASPDAVQLAVLNILRATTLQPLERDAALQTAIEFGEAPAEEALRHLVALNLVREIVADDGRSAVFNPNVWVGDAEVALAALRVEDASVRDEVGALLEEVSAAPGIPELNVLSTEQRWIDFAVAHGLIQRSVVQTSEGDEKRFLFAPHLGRDAFGTAPGDVSGHVRQLVGSMIYAATFPNNKLYSPTLFIRRLIREGEAGNASEIGTDYPMLETAGIVRVVPGASTGKFRFQLLQVDVAEKAEKILKSRVEPRNTGNAQSRALDLTRQRSYTHIERERARLAVDAPGDTEDFQKLVAALRESTVRRGFRG